ncbi:PAAR domain-containing protein [Iodobacter sp. CM08]|uniref:PAAR domain-containing protein n=1 Tax=Iodobacter sp. CM08 TaxID=3085902 RepID=UPI0029822B91|nr:PAAR domain-containing protein [Iodobacter sp. CM08]MDW5419243.1 PAAR domain-containing protein [Iodobacter sp. CM08]
MKRVIRLGDQTSHGGVVISAASTSNMFGKPVALLGDKVSCPIPGHGVCPIIEGDPSWNVGGKSVALEGHKTSCGAVLISSMPEVGRSYEGSGAASSGASNSAKKTMAAAAAIVAAADYDQHFALTDDLTGKPLANRMYRINWSGGIVEGRTDAQGHTQKINGTKPEEITIEVFAENP